MAIAITPMKQPLIQQSRPRYQPIQDTGAEGTPSGLTAQIYGDSPTQYKKVYDDAAKALGQAGGSSVDDIINATKFASKEFIKNYYKQYGVLPDEETLKGGVARIAGSSDFAKKWILRTPMDVLGESFIKPSVGDAEAPVSEDIGIQDETGLEDKANQIYGSLSDYLAKTNKESTDQNLKQYYESRAALGELRDPSSIVGENQIRTQGQNALAAGQAGLASTQATGTTDLAKTIASIRSQGKIADQNYNISRGLLGLKQSEADTNANLGQQKIDLAKLIGQQQADNARPGPLDYLNTAVNVGGTVARGYNDYQYNKNQRTQRNQTPTTNTYSS